MEEIFLNGKFVSKSEAVIPVSCLGVTLGASVFEACRVNWNNSSLTHYLFRIRDHIDRLYNSMKIMRMNLMYSKNDILEIVLQLVKRWRKKQNGYIRIMVYIASESPGSSVYHPDCVSSDLCITLKDSDWPSEIYKGINCCVSSWKRIEDNSMPPRVKSACNYENTRLAGQEAILNGYENAIFLNNMGKISEAAESAVFIIDGNHRLITPETSADILESISRDTIIKLWKTMGKEVIQRCVDRTELYLAEEVFLANTAKLIRPVINIDKYIIGNGKIGVVTKEIQKDFFDAVRGNSKYFDESSVII